MLLRAAPSHGSSSANATVHRMSASAVAARAGTFGVIVARREIAAPRERVFEFLADLNNHWLLADRFIEMVRLDDSGSGGRVRLCGPFGLRRTATTQVDELEYGDHVRGSASIGPVTRGSVCWTLEDAGSGTLITLEVQAERLSRLDAVLVRLGGRRWLGQVFARILERLEERLG